MAEFRKYRRQAKYSELRPYEPGEDVSGISINEDDRTLRGSPKVGDMVARNPTDHGNVWLVEKQYFADNFDPLPVD